MASRKKKVTSSEPRLSPKEKAWAHWWVKSQNATEAARRAGYKGDDNSLAVIGHKNLIKAKIQEYIRITYPEGRTAEEKLIADGEEVMMFLTKVMRGEEKDQFGLDPSLKDRLSAAEKLGKIYGVGVKKKEDDGGESEDVIVQPFYGCEEDLEELENGSQEEN